MEGQGPSSVSAWLGRWGVNSASTGIFGDAKAPILLCEDRETGGRAMFAVGIVSPTYSVPSVAGDGWRAKGHRRSRPGTILGVSSQYVYIITGVFGDAKTKCYQFWMAWVIRGRIVGRCCRKGVVL